jgi:hypothetical protein
MFFKLYMFISWSTVSKSPPSLASQSTTSHFLSLRRRCRGRRGMTKFALNGTQEKTPLMPEAKEMRTGLSLQNFDPKKYMSHFWGQKLAQYS